MCCTSAVLKHFVLFAVSQLPPVRGAPEVNSTLEDRTLVAVVGLVSAAVFLVVAVYALINCNDCYNSEVSTDTHPATGNTGVKWGGAGGYAAAASSDVNDPVLGAGFTGEVITPGGNHPLPYAMIPTQVPEAQGFRGYETAGSQGLTGYGSQGGWASAASASVGGGGGDWGGASREGGGPRSMPGAHISPVMQQDPQGPPPAYGDAAY